MTAIIMQRSKEPAQCMACARMASGIGIHEHKRPVHAWTCDDPACIRATKGMTVMGSNELTRIERIAIEYAARAIVEPVMSEVVGAMWAQGIRSLETTTPEQVSLALDDMIVSGAMQEHVKAALLEFGKSVKASVLGNEAPF